jgi:hypothetical protein
MKNFNKIREKRIMDETVEYGINTVSSLGMSEMAFNNSKTLTESSKQRLIMITASIDEKITSCDEAYKNLLNALENLHNSGLIQDSDYVCYNIGSPLLSNFLKSDS